MIMMEKSDTPFEIRAYSKKELALLYFPTSTHATAVSHLKVWLRRCAPLWAELEATGYDKHTKCFTPLQVRLIVKYLGDP